MPPFDFPSAYLLPYLVRETVMPFLEFIHVPLILFLVIVAPLWIITHYVMRWRSTKTLSADDEKVLSELWESVPKMEGRIKNLERILDAEVPDWRQQI